MLRKLRNPFALVCAGVGLLLLGIAFHFNVNPVDCGAVRGGLQDHPFLFLPLVVATIPAMYVGMVAVGVLTLISGPADHPAGYFAGAFVAQFLIYFVLGLVLSKIVRLMRGKNNHPAQHKMTLQPIMDILDARAGGVIPGHVVPEIRCLLEYLNGHGVVWSGFNHSKDDLEQGVVDEIGSPSVDW